MEICRHCGRERDSHIGIRETCPDLPAQRFAPVRPERPKPASVDQGESSPL